jgi:hypothetical protein
MFIIIRIVSDIGSTSWRFGSYLGASVGMSHLPLAIFAYRETIYTGLNRVNGLHGVRSLLKISDSGSGLML